MTAETPTSRFVVKKCDTERHEEDVVHSVFLVPQMADYEGDDDDDPVGDLLFEVRQDAIPNDLEFRTTTEKVGPERLAEDGVWVVVPEPIEPGTVVDLQLRIVGVLA